MVAFSVQMDTLKVGFEKYNQEFVVGLEMELEPGVSVRINDGSGCLG